MVIRELLPNSSYGALHNPGGYIFQKNKKALILTKNGNTALVNEEVLRSLQNGVVPTESKAYLINRGILQLETHSFNNKKFLSR